MDLNWVFLDLCLNYFLDLDRVFLDLCLSHVDDPINDLYQHHVPDQVDPVDLFLDSLDLTSKLWISGLKMASSLWISGSETASHLQMART